MYIDCLRSSSWFNPYDPQCSQQLFFYILLPSPSYTLKFSISDFLTMKFCSAVLISLMQSTMACIKLSVNIQDYYICKDIEQNLLWTIHSKLHLPLSICRWIVSIFFSFIRIHNFLGPFDYNDTRRWLTAVNHHFPVKK